ERDAAGVGGTGRRRADVGPGHAPPPADVRLAARRPHQPGGRAGRDDLRRRRRVGGGRRLGRGLIVVWRAGGVNPLSEWRQRGRDDLRVLTPPARQSQQPHQSNTSPPVGVEAEDHTFAAALALTTRPLPSIRPTRMPPDRLVSARITVQPAGLTPTPAFAVEYSDGDDVPLLPI